MDNENNYQQYEFNDKLNLPQRNINSQNDLEEQNSFQNDLLHGVNSNLNMLLSNLTSTNRIRSNTFNNKETSPIKINSNNFSNLNLVEAYDYLIENNLTRKNNYLSPDRPQNQNNFYDKSYSYNGKNNNSLYSNTKLKTGDNSFLTRNDYINNITNDNNSFLSQPINYTNNKSNILIKAKTFNKNNNTERNAKSLKRPNNSNSNKLKRNNRALSFQNMKINMVSQNPQNIALYDIIRQLKELNIVNIENKNDVLNIQQEYNKMKNILLSVINKFANIQINKNNYNNNQKQKEMNLKLQQVNNIKNKLLSDINILNNEKS